MGSPRRLSLTLTVDPVRYVVARFPVSDPWPAPTPGDDAFFSVTRTGGEVSLVATPEQVPAGATARDEGWRRLEVVGPLDLSIVGVMAELAGVLAEAGVSIFPVATHDTDHLLVRAEQLAPACAALGAAGHLVHGSRGPGSPR